MIAVAVVAVAAAGLVTTARWRRLAAVYRYNAWAYGGNVRMEFQRLAKLKREREELVSEGKFDFMEMSLNAARIERARAAIAANDNIVRLFEHAANHPWEERPSIIEALEGVEDKPFPKRLGAGPRPPAPPNPFP
jgi:hypothetical protein